MITIPFLAIPHILGSPPVIGIATIDTHPFFDESMGAWSNPASVPFYNFIDHMTFFERIQNFYCSVLISYYQFW